MTTAIIELSIHACNFVLKALDREGPGARGRLWTSNASFVARLFQNGDVSAKEYAIV